MAASKQSRTQIISLSLMVTFLFTAIALPIVSSHAIGNEIRHCALTSANDISNQSAQLPLAEKENEEESLTEKDQNLSFILISGPVELSLVLSTPVRFTSAVTEQITPSEVPLYLVKRTLLI